MFVIDRLDWLKCHWQLYLVRARPLSGSHLCSTCSSWLPSASLKDWLHFCCFWVLWIWRVGFNLQDGNSSNLPRFAAQTSMSKCWTAFGKTVLLSACWLRNGASFGGRHGWLSFNWVGGDCVTCDLMCSCFLTWVVHRSFPGKSRAATWHDEPGPTWPTWQTVHLANVSQISLSEGGCGQRQHMWWAYIKAWRF